MSHPLTALFSPRSIAFVGATERSVWTRAALANLRTLGYDGKVFLVNRKGGEVLGYPALSSLREIGEPVDVALLMVPSDALLDTVSELGAAGIRNAIILSAGFAESGVAGRELQSRLTTLAREHNISLLGPNCLGFVNFIACAPVWTVSLRPQPARGTPVTDAGASDRHAARAQSESGSKAFAGRASVEDPGTSAAKIAIVSQSGALAAQMSYFAQWQGIGLTYMVSTGNEAGIGVAQVIDYLVDDSATRAIALFLESVRDTEAFTRACLRAAEAGKPIVVLKVGSSEVTARSAQAHTGSLVGDDRVFDAVCRRLGLVRVTSLEDLILTAEVLARWGTLPEGGLGLISLSGGLCEIAADRAADAGVSLPALSPTTTARLAADLPDFGTPHNPLDVTGGALLDPSLLEKSLDAMSAESAFSAVLAVLDVPGTAADDSKVLRHLLDGVAAAQSRASCPTFLISHTVRPFSELSQEILDASGCNYLPCGLEHGIRAVARAFEWSKLSREVRQPSAVAASVADARPGSEREVMEYLRSRGVPVVPTQVVTTSDEAVRCAHQFAGPVALKIASPDIAHKTEVGGVVLDVTGDNQVAAAFENIMTRAREAAPHARFEGVSVSPMRKGGVELFVGTMRDPQWGPVITVGLGGVWVEVLRDTSLRLLPISHQVALSMLDELRGRALLDGFRGTPAVDRDAVANVIVAIGNAALALGPQLLSLEINPLRANGDHVEALDGWAEWIEPKR